jgi:hypothetical protein
VPDDIIQAMSRMRGREIDSEWLTGYAARLRQQFPDISNAVLAQMLASIEGVDVGRIQRLLVGHDADSRAAPDVDLELEMSGDSTHPNVIAKPKMKEGRGAEAHRAERREAGEQPERTAPATLTKEDLALLKRVPRRSDNQRRSA